MNALNGQAVEAALALCRDAYGNLRGGQDARALGYLGYAISVLGALQESAESKGDVRAEKALKVALDEALDGVDTLQPPFDLSLVGAAHAKYEAMGIPGEGVLQSLEITDLPEDHPIRKLVADLEK
ncbi:hypothetical protein [Paraburkholderia adhaesiva]|uniref:hypothetical protein n=1 Tax=Paraburkholderia adhaesiva TaxID=2883244 RepID=UPI001F3C41BE|nr:hypothetical protein [Paraburkholderia adhaesiva]